MTLLPCAADMRWLLVESITAVDPGSRIRGTAHTRFSDPLFADHFPGFPVTPGVLLVEMAAQLCGKLIEATVWEQRGFWIFPILSIIQDAKFRAFVPPRVNIELGATLVELRDESAICKATVSRDGKRHATMTLLFVFDPSGKPPDGDRGQLEAYERAEFVRLGSPWVPSTQGPV